MVRWGYHGGWALVWSVLTLPAAGQTVQLPSFDYFSVNTSVMVPDRGGAYLGGVRRSSQGSRRLGLPGAGSLPAFGRLLGNRALGGSAGGGGVSVHATIIDHEAMDRALLAEAARRRKPNAAAFSPELSAWSQQLRGAAAAAAEEPGLASVAEIRRQHAANRAAEQREARQLASKGWEAEQQGSLGAAKIFYQMAFRRADGDLRQQVAERLERLTRSITPKSPAGSGRSVDY